MTRVCYILRSFPNTSETFILEELLSLQRQGVDCHVFSLFPPGPQPLQPHARELLDAGKVTYCRWPSRWGKTALLARRFLRQPGQTRRAWRRFRADGGPNWTQSNALLLARKIESLRADHIHAHFADLPSQYALAVHRWTGIPFTLTPHGHDVYFAPPDNYPELAEAARAVLCISQYNRRYFMEHFVLPPEKLPVIRCGIDTSLFSPPGDQSPCDPAGGPLKLLCVARLHTVKGHAFLLEAVAQLRTAGLACELTLVGDGPQRGVLEEQCRRLGLLEQVRFLGMQVQPEIIRLYRQCDLVVLPSVSDAMPVSLMEALACARPVVATAVRAVPELVQDGVTGLLCPPSDSPALAEAIQWMAQHPQDAQAMGQRGRQRVLEQFDRQRCTRQLIDLWNGAPVPASAPDDAPAIPFSRAAEQARPARRSQAC